MNLQFWKNKRVLITGHTGFKGSWLALWLLRLGAQVSGYSLRAPTIPNLSDLIGLEKHISSYSGDVRRFEKLTRVIQTESPEIIFHLAAQSLVGPSYRVPLETFSTNILGTANVCEAVRSSTTTKVLVIVTTDKCYENREWVYGYRETDRLGGADPYSASKACAELVTSCYQEAFFSGATNGPAVATVRAGNVIGGGDWAEGRLIPDLIRSIGSGQPLTLRRPQAKRPWQFVLEPLHGYLLLAQALWARGKELSGPWNFGPEDHSIQSVETVLRQFEVAWRGALPVAQVQEAGFHETHTLKLDSSKAKSLLGWRPLLSLPNAIEWTAKWYHTYLSQSEVLAITYQQLDEFGSLIQNGGMADSGSICQQSGNVPQ